MDKKGGGRLAGAEVEHLDVGLPANVVCGEQHRRGVHHGQGSEVREPYRRQRVARACRQLARRTIADRPPAGRGGHYPLSKTISVTLEHIESI